MNDRIQHEVDKTLECLGTGPDIPANPLFAEKLSRRVAGVRVKRAGGVGSRISYPLVIVLLIVLNVVAGLVRLGTQQTSSDAAGNPESVLASEYGIGQSDLASF